ncbi:related to protein RTA1 [Phialocephala subalpina]|uniref:Related to protein RTA1 n=1 Tax=Phialocephala subalpina TaxID=576137 RepID=A0A1L7XWU4_9HELO|nr:related to protein RTA1 [Phialocephala subalpina]
MANDAEPYKLYHYNPSFNAAVAFIALFALTTLLHVIQMLKSRSWYFIPFVIGGIFESLGYTGRAINSKESPKWKTGPYIMQSLLLLLAPAFFAATIYMILGRIITLTGGESRSVIKVTWLTKIFVSGDVLSFLTQSGGGAILSRAKTSSRQKLGSWIITAGLGIQVFFFGLFILCAVVFHQRMANHPSRRSKTLDVPWRGLLWILYVDSGLIMIRSVFRIVEYIQGNDGALLKRELYLYIFDAGLMFLAMLILNNWHPSLVLSAGEGDHSLQVVEISRTKEDFASHRIQHGRSDRRHHHSRSSRVNSAR